MNTRAIRPFPEYEVDRSDREFTRLVDAIMAKGLMMCIWTLALLAILLPSWDIWINQPFVRWPLVALFAGLAAVSGRWLWLVASYSPEKIKKQRQKPPFRTDSEVRR